MPAPDTILPFLNRIAIITKESPLSIDPQTLLAQLALFASAEEYQELFDKFCHSALNDHYSWNESPGNLLFVCERIEMLIETAYLISQTATTTNQAVEHCKENALTFFNRQSLASWKCEFDTWMQAAFNNDPVSDSLPPSSVHPFISNIKMLIQCIPDLSS